MTKILTLVLIAGCANACTASKGDPHKFGACGSALAQTEVECEAACADGAPPPVQPLVGCDGAFTPNRPGVIYTCGDLATISWDDNVRGCCKNDFRGSDGSGRQIFAECP